MTLRAVIIMLLNGRALTYREITGAINRQRLYIPKDGMLIPEAQVRATIRESAKFFEIDKGVSPHTVSLRR